MNTCASYGWKWENKPSADYAWVGYYANYLKLSNYDVRLDPFCLLYGGYIGAGSLNGAGSEGLYWSSTAYNSGQAYFLDFNSSNVLPSNVTYRYYGLSIRCLAR